jgi:hypothetical protein
LEKKVVTNKINMGGLQHQEQEQQATTTAPPPKRKFGRGKRRRLEHELIGVHNLKDLMLKTGELELLRREDGTTYCPTVVPDESFELRLEQPGPSAFEQLMGDKTLWELFLRGQENDYVQISAKRQHRKRRVTDAGRTQSIANFARSARQKLRGVHEEFVADLEKMLFGFDYGLTYQGPGLPLKSEKDEVSEGVNADGFAFLVDPGRDAWILRDFPPHLRKIIYTVCGLYQLPITKKNNGAVLEVKRKLLNRQLSLTKALGIKKDRKLFVIKPQEINTVFQPLARTQSDDATNSSAFLKEAVESPVASKGSSTPGGFEYLMTPTTSKNTDDSPEVEQYMFGLLPESESPARCDNREGLEDSWEQVQLLANSTDLTNKNNTKSSPKFNMSFSSVSSMAKEHSTSSFEIPPTPLNHIEFLRSEDFDPC